MTAPVEEIIPRSFPEDIHPIVTFFVETIEELVNFGSHIMKWDLQPPMKGDDAVAPIMMLRHYLDVIDSIGLLVKYGSGDTGKILLRACFETMLGLEFLLEKDSTNRSMAFLVSDILVQIKTLKKMNPVTIEGIELNSIFTAEHNINTSGIAKKHDLNKALAGKESVLQKPEFQPAYQEFLKLKALKVSNPPWYRYFGGPSNIQGLAKHLGHSSLYETLYRQYSGTVHGSQIYLGKMSSAATTGMVEIVQLRYFKDVQEIATYTQLFSIKLFRLYILKRIPTKEKDLKDWYIANRERFQAMTAKDYIHVV